MYSLSFTLDINTILEPCGKKHASPEGSTPVPNTEIPGDPNFVMSFPKKNIPFGYQISGTKSSRCFGVFFGVHISQFSEDSGVKYTEKTCFCQNFW